MRSLDDAADRNRGVIMQYPTLTVDGTMGLSAGQLRSMVTELCSALRSSLDNERGSAEESLQRVVEILQGIQRTAPSELRTQGGLCSWQIRKVTSYIETRLDRPITNENLAAVVRLNPCHFGRAFRNSVGEPPHAYVMRRRVERAQGIMLSTDASLSDIALDCGLADQAHLSRLFRRIVGETPSAWRRARRSAPVESGAIRVPSDSSLSRGCHHDQVQ